MDPTLDKGKLLGKKWGQYLSNDTKTNPKQKKFPTYLICITYLLIQ